MDIAQQREGDSPQLGELRVGEVTVTADAEEDGAAVLDLAVDQSQVRELRRSDTAPVVAVEGQDDVLPPQTGEGHRGTRVRRQGEVRGGLAVPEPGHEPTAVMICAWVIALLLVEGPF